jgi:hypothetical protein
MPHVRRLLRRRPPQKVYEYIRAHGPAGPVIPAPAAARKPVKKGFWSSFLEIFRV